MKCTICSSSQFQHGSVLWPELIEAWGIDQREVDYINRQQGTFCCRCGNNLRAQAMAQAICAEFSFKGSFKRFLKSWRYRRLKVLSVNTCGTLHSLFSRLPNFELIEYPEYDVRSLSLPSDTYDLVVHSDTLEHVDGALAALSECCRVLKPGGVCIYTIPIIVGRMSQTTEGKPPSYHGDPEERGGDWQVQTEYGCDAWLEPLKSGFRSCRIHAFEVPSAFAFGCRK